MVRQIGLKFTEGDDDIALYDLLKGYGKGNIKLHLHKAFDLYEMLRRIDCVDGAVEILKNEYPHVVSELRTDHNRAMERRMELLENNMRQQATKDDIDAAVEMITGQMHMLATQESVDSLRGLAVAIVKQVAIQMTQVDPVQKEGLPSGTKLLIASRSEDAPSENH